MFLVLWWDIKCQWQKALQLWQQECVCEDNQAKAIITMHTRWHTLKTLCSNPYLHHWIIHLHHLISTSQSHVVSVVQPPIQMQQHTSLSGNALSHRCTSLCLLVMTTLTCRHYSFRLKRCLKATYFKKNKKHHQHISRFFRSMSSQLTLTISIFIFLSSLIILDVPMDLES